MSKKTNPFEEIALETQEESGQLLQLPPTNDKDLYNTLITTENSIITETAKFNKSNDKSVEESRRNSTRKESLRRDISSMVITKSTRGPRNSISSV